MITLYILFQHEETEVVKKQIFISPFKRYKCVIPMIAEQEAKEREKQQKEEEEKRLNETTMIKDKTTDEVEIIESKNRVYEHFKQVSQSLNEEVQNSSNDNNKKKKKKKKKSNILLSQMPNRKRKKEFDFKKESDYQESSNQNFSTPAPSLDVRIQHIPKKMKQQTQNALEKQKTQKIVAQLQGNKNLNAVKPIR